MGSELDSIDLTVNQRKTVVDLLRRHLPNTTAWAYGSRVKFTSKPKSDLDLVVFAEPEQSIQVAALKEAFDESDLPFRVDLFVWDEVPEKFRMNIEAERVVLMEREELEVPSEWTTLPFNQAVLVNPAVRLEKRREYPFVEMAAVDPNRRGVSESECRMSGSGGARFKAFDTLLARITPCLENGKIARFEPLSRSPKVIAFGSTEFIVIRGKDGVTDNHYAYYLTKWEEFRQFAIGQMTGSSGRQRVPADSLSGFQAPVPPLPEQKAIAHVLGSLDDKIEMNRQMNATLEAMAQALFKSWFVNFDPVIDNALAAGNPIPDEIQARASVRESLGDARKPLPEHLQNLFPAAFTNTEELGWIPEGWAAQPLYSIASFINGAAYKNFHFTDEAGALPVVKIAEVKGGISSQTKFTKTELAEKYRIDDGDILFSWSGNPDTSIDTFVWTGGRGWLNQHIFRVALMAVEDRNFVYYQLKLLRPVFAEIARNKQTTGLGHVTAQDMKRLPIIHPPEPIKIAFNKLVSPLFDRWYANLIHNRDLAKTLDTLLPKLLSGELRLPLEELEVTV
jgi:type I restriction enzyme S subunit